MPETSFVFYLAIFGGALAASSALTPLAIRVARRMDIVDHPAAHKFHQRSTPYLGGAAIGLAVLAGVVVLIVGKDPVRLQLAAVALGGAAVGVVGLVDDLRGVGALPRIGVETLAALTLWGTDVRLTPTGVPLLDLAATIFVVLLVTNAINLLDNMDGLTTGTVAIAGVFLLVTASWQGQYLVALMATVLAGACLGFLPFNFSPARVFLGDAGTLFLGFLVATIVIKANLNGYPLITRAAVPVLILAVPLFDTLLVVVSRWRGGRPVFRGGTDHSSHRLVAMGASTSQAAVVTYTAATVAGAVGLLLLQARTPFVTWAVVLVGALVAAFLLWRLEQGNARVRRRAGSSMGVARPVLSFLPAGRPRRKPARLDPR